jgi:hypothetical protein
MKNYFFGLILACSLVVPAVSNAELLIYRGSMNMRRAGNGGESHHTYRVYVLVDHATAQVTKINYYPVAGGLFYSVDDPVSFSTSSVEIANGRSNTVLAAGESSVNDNNQATISSAFVKGTNARLPVKHGVVLEFPRLFDWNYSGLRPLPERTSSETWQETGLLAYDRAGSVYSNAHEETVADARGRITARLEAMGYREVKLQ